MLINKESIVERKQGGIVENVSSCPTTQIFKGKMKKLGQGVHVIKITSL